MEKRKISVVEKRGVIFYFSGTGNSLYVARKLAKALNMNIEGIPAVLKSGITEIKEEFVGIVCPVYYLELPKIVTQFLSTVKFSKDAYIFSVLDCGGISGGGLNYVYRSLKKNGATLSYGDFVVMPSNEQYERKDCEDSAQRYIKANMDLVKIEEEIKERKVNSSSMKSKPSRLLTKIYWFTGKTIYHMGKKTVDDKKCTLCHKCIDVCPIDCIEVIDGHIVINKAECFSCMACLQYCPERAIKIGGIKINDTNHYTHPEITVKDIMNEKQLHIKKDLDTLDKEDKE